MKKILLFSLLTVVLLIISGCENGLNHDGKSLISAQNIRGAASDPVADCIMEETHQHDGVHYSGHYNNDVHGHHGLQADDVCALPACETTTSHTHNGIHYAGHNGSCDHDGNGHHGRNGHHG